MLNDSCFYISRAATGIFLILKTQIKDRKNKFVLVPANICYAAVLPIIYCGLNVRFCDVDPITGNATLNSFSKSYNDDVVAAIIPHMYGNPVADLNSIASFCKKNNVLLIEDCASAMGAVSSNYELGSQGDFTVYSMGYSKTVDLGYGGIIATTKDLSAIITEERELPFYTGTSPELSTFSKLYRILRNNNYTSGFESAIYSVFPKAVKNELLCRIDYNQREYLINGLKTLHAIIEKRKSDLLIYQNQLGRFKECFYPFSKGSVPWRFCMLLSKELKSKAISECLKNGLPVSDWYPRVTSVFGNTEEFSGAKLHEERIINFPLLISESNINEICKTLNTIL